jgi:hypothetical protein
VDPVTPDALRAAEEAVHRLVRECRRGGSLYARDPRAVTRLGRTARWLLWAIASLRRALATPRADGSDSQEC